MGTALPETNLPPVVDESSVPDSVELVAGAGAGVIDLSDWFNDPEGDTLSFSAVSSAPSAVAAVVSGSELTLTPLATGGGWITVWAEDGTNPPVEWTFYALVYPQPLALGGSNFHFDQWDSSEPAGSFPAHMIFLQSEVSDPGLGVELLFAYTIEGDAHASDNPAFPYAAGHARGSMV